jgi:hypothetical protein
MQRVQAGHDLAEVSLRLPNKGARTAWVIDQSYSERNTTHAASWNRSIRALREPGRTASSGLVRNPRVPEGSPRSIQGTMGQHLRTSMAYQVDFLLPVIVDGVNVADDVRVAKFL